MKNNFLKKALLLHIIIFIGINVYSQESLISNRWNYKLGFSPYPNENKNSSILGNLQGEVNYGLLKFMEVGVYVGVTPFHQASFVGNSYQSFYQKAPMYGINFNFHPLTFLINKSDFRFDVYLAGKAGGYYFFGEDTDAYHGAEWKLFIGGGAAFYLWRHFGIYTEYGYEWKTVYISNNKNITSFRYGISLKF